MHCSSLLIKSCIVIFLKLRINGKVIFFFFFLDHSIELLCCTACDEWLKGTGLFIAAKAQTSHTHKNKASLIAFMFTRSKEPTVRCHHKVQGTSTLRASLFTSAILPMLPFIPAVLVFDCMTNFTGSTRASF